MGLRKKKKEQRERRIMDAGMELFTGQGFGATSMEQIAERAEVGVGTVYNYFKNKNTLLVAIFDEAHGKSVSRIGAIADNPPDDPVEGVLDVLFSYDTWEVFGKPLLREVFSVFFLEMGDMGREFMRMDMEVMGQLGVLLTEYKRRGAVDADVNVQEAAMLIYGGFFMQISIYVAMDDLSMDMLKEMARGQFALMFRGLLPREKR